MTNKIVVGYNGTSSSDNAAMWAAHEADVRKMPLRVVTCFEMPMLSSEAALGLGGGAAFEAVSEAANTNAERIKAEIGAAFPTLTFTTVVAADAAATALLDDVGPDDLVVVGSSSHEGAAAFWLGSTPRHLVRHSPCPVAVVRGGAGRDAPDRIVVGVDGSAASHRALHWAGDEADRYDVELVVVHGWSYPYEATDTSSLQARELTEIDADCTLNRAVETARERCGVTVTGCLVEGSPVSAVLETARDGDMIVVGSRGRGGIRSRLFGSTANAILDNATVPVVVIRAEPPADESDLAASESTLAHTR